MHFETEKRRVALVVLSYIFLTLGLICGFGPAFVIGLPSMIVSFILILCAVGTPSRFNRANGIVILSILVPLAVVSSVVHTYANIASTQTAAQSATQPVSAQNLQNQQTCISIAKTQVESQYPPVGGDTEAQSIAAQEQANALKPQIAQCQQQYPTN